MMIKKISSSMTSKNKTQTSLTLESLALNQKESSDDTGPTFDLCLPTGIIVDQSFLKAINQNEVTNIK